MRLILGTAFLVFGLSALSLCNPTNEDVDAVVQDVIKAVKERSPAGSMKGKKVTRESRIMQEHNKIVRTTRKQLQEAHPGLDRQTANKVVLQGLARLIEVVEQRELLKNVGTAGGHTVEPKIMAPYCARPDSEKICDYQLKYRTITGECNSIVNNQAGASSTKFRRLKPAAYADYHDEPRGTYQSFLDTCTKTGNKKGSDYKSCKRPNNVLLPNPRRVSQVIHRNINRPDPAATLMVMQFAQFVDHDITFTPEDEIEEEEGGLLACCEGKTDGKFHEGCIPIVSPCYDNTFVNRVFDTASHADKKTCAGIMPLTRSTAFCDGNTTIREQFNGITHFVDASNVYGSVQEVGEELRLHQAGLLKEGEGSLLPLIKNEENGESEFTGGDVRARENPGLSAMHTVWLREHNRIAKFIKGKKPVLNDEEIFQQARRIVIAQKQNVVYGQFLREVVGTNAYFGKNLMPSIFGSQYDVRRDPTISNEFASAAFRYGHSMIQDLVKMVNLVTQQQSTFLLRQNFFNDTLYVSQMDALITGMILQPAQAVDESMASAITETLFANTNANGGLSSDLMARNIQRGREHGIPGYNEIRKACGLPKACSFDTPPSNIPASIWKRLATVYDHPSDIDLWTGGISENSVAGGHLGETFACVVSNQFQDLMLGDRFFFTHNPIKPGKPASNLKYGIENNPNPFTTAQLRSLRSRNYGDILCDNTKLLTVRKNVFRSDSPFLSCAIGKRKLRTVVSYLRTSDGRLFRITRTYVENTTMFNQLDLNLFV